MNKIFIVLSALMLLISCNSFSQKKSFPEITEVDKNGLDISSELLGKIKKMANKPILPLKREVWNYDSEGNEESYTLNKGIYFDFVDEETAHKIFKTFTDQVTEEGNYLFLTEMDFDDSYTKTYYDIVILKCNNQFDLIKLVATNGVNYDVYNEDVVHKMKEWHEEVNFEIVVVDAARIHAYMHKPPTNMKNFAEEVYEFCPDVIDQGYGSMDQMISDYQASNYFWLWWD